MSIETSAVTAIALTYATGTSWSVFTNSNLATAGNLQANWNDTLSGLSGQYKPLLNSCAEEINIMQGVSGADTIGISGITGVSIGSTVYSAIYSLNTAVSAINTSLTNTDTVLASATADISALSGSSLASILTTSGDIVYASTSGVPSRLGVTSADMSLVVNSSGVPSWQHTKGFHSDLAAWYGNTGTADDGNTSWSSKAWGNADSGVVADDTVNYKIGAKSQKCTGAADGDGIHRVVALDWSELINGETVTDDDYITIAIYVTDKTLLHADGLKAIIANDAFGTLTNYFHTSFAASALSSGWNYKDVRIGDLTEVGSPSIASITGYSIAFNGAPSSSTTFSLQLLQPVKKDPLAAYPNPFQRFGARDFAINSGEWFVGLENGEIVWRNLNPSETGITSTAASLVGVKGYGSTFKTYIKQIVKTANELNRLVWEINANNRIAVTVTGSILYLYITVTATNNTTTNTAFTCAIGDIVEFFMERNGTTVTLLAVKNGNYSSPTLLTKEVSFSSVGYLAIGDRVSTYQNIQSLSITTTDHANHANVAEVAKTLAIKYMTTAATAGNLSYGEFAISTGDNRMYLLKDASGGIVYYIGLTTA